MIEALLISNIILSLLIALPVIAVLSYITEEMGPALTTIILIGFLVFGYFVFSFNVFYFVYSNFTTVVFWTLGYLLIGVLYSFVKWYLYVLKKKEDGLNKRYVKLETNRAATWIVYWPLSLFWTLLSDILTRLVTRIVNLFGNIYNSIVDYVYKDVKDDKSV